MKTIIHFVLYANWLLYFGIFVYSIFWSVKTLRAGQWKDTKERVVARNENAKFYWFGIALVLAVGVVLLVGASLLVVFRESIADTLLRPR